MGPLYRLTDIQSPTSAYNFNYEYDKQGNIVKRGAQLYVFDQGNRLKSAIGKATYAYDGLGHRISIVGNDSVNRVQVYSQGGQLLYAAPSGGVGTKYVYLKNHLVAQVSAKGTSYSHTDGLGSPVARTNESGALTCRTQYEPYGLVAAGSTQTIGFTGHVNDAETGLTYMQQRYYDPVAGRFLSIDPVITDANTGGSFNRYAYAENNPYRYTDPDGRQARTIGINCMEGNCTTYGGDNGQKTADRNIGMAVGAVAGAAAGIGLSAACDGITWGACVVANPAMVGASMVAGAGIGANLIPPVLESSRLVAKNIFAVTQTQKLQGQVSHHIAAETDPRAAVSRSILAANGMSVNSAYNGMNMNGPYHQRLHTDLYHATVQAALTGAGSYSSVAVRLTAIRAQINMGAFPF